VLDAGVRELTDLLQTLGLVAQFLYVPALNRVDIGADLRC
jgi:hypothetical protein